MRTKIYYLLALCLLLVMTVPCATNAQVNPLISMYYQNPYFANPAMAGAKKGLHLNVAYKHELVGENGKRATNALTTDYQFKNMGLGLSALMEKDGLIDANRYLITYAYHLKVKENSALHFGLSAGISTEKLNTSDIIGDTEDPLIMQYNDITPSFDADFGLAYTSENWTAQAVLPNIRDLFENKPLQRIYSGAKFYGSVAYKYKLDFGILKPQVAFRNLKYYDNVIDMGLNYQTNGQQFNATVMYHSNQNISTAMGFAFLQKYDFQIVYVTPVNSNLQKYTYGNVQLGVKLKIIE